MKMLSQLLLKDCVRSRTAALAALDSMRLKCIGCFGLTSRLRHAVVSPALGRERGLLSGKGEMQPGVAAANRSDPTSGLAECCKLHAKSIRNGDADDMLLCCSLIRAAVAARGPSSPSDESTYRAPPPSSSSRRLPRRAMRLAIASITTRYRTSHPIDLPLAPLCP